MTTIKHQAINTGNFANYGNPKVNKRYEDAPTTQPKIESAIDFSKPSQDLPLTESMNLPETTPTEPTDQTQTDQDRRNERRNSFKRASDIEQRAMQMQKQAETTLNQTKQVQQFLSLIDTDPVKAVQALGKDPNIILQKYQNGMFNIPNEPEKPKELTVDERLAKYETERQKEKEELLQYKSQSIKNNYIQTNILPVIQSEPETFELLNMNGIDTCAQFIYDMMDAHYKATGETLNARDVAEEMENQLTKEFEERFVATRKIKKFAKHFSQDTDAPGQDISVPEQLGQSAPQIRSSQTNQSSSQLGHSDSSTNVRPTQGPPVSRPIQPTASPSQLLGNDAQANSYQRQTQIYNKKQARLNKIEEFARANDIKRNI